jgi:hypothetical protein
MITMRRDGRGRGGGDGKLTDNNDDDDANDNDDNDDDNDDNEDDNNNDDNDDDNDDNDKDDNGHGDNDNNNTTIRQCTGVRGRRKTVGAMDDGRQEKWQLLRRDSAWCFNSLTAMRFRREQTSLAL